MSASGPPGWLAVTEARARLVLSDPSMESSGHLAAFAVNTISRRGPEQLVDGQDHEQRRLAAGPVRYGPAVRGRGGQCLKASLIFAPACLVSPLTWSPRPSVLRRRLPVARPTLFLAPPLTASASCAIFLAMLMGGCLSWGHLAGADAAGTSGAGCPFSDSWSAAEACRGAGRRPNICPQLRRPSSGLRWRWGGGEPFPWAL